jgi:Putative peptidoglycan binding domain
MIKLNFASLGCAACLIAFTLASATATETLDPAAVNQAQLSPKSKARRVSSAVRLRAQVLLDRAHFSTAVIDGKSGENTRRAIAAFQKARGLGVDGKLDNETFAKLLHCRSAREWRSASSAPAVAFADRCRGGGSETRSQWIL